MNVWSRLEWLKDKALKILPGQTFKVDLSTLSLVLMILIYSFIFSNIAIIKHNLFGTSGFDIGIMDQGTWLLSQGKNAFVTVNGLHIFGGHASPILLLLAPLYWIWSDIRLLLILQSVILAIGAVPLYLIAKDRIGSRWIALVFPFSYLLYPPLEYINLWQFHPEALATTFILFAFYYVTKKKYSFFYLFSFLALLCKEDVSLIIFFLGAYVFIKHDQKVGIITSLGALVWFVISMKVILPHYNDLGSIHLAIRYSHLGSGPFDIIKTAILNPKLIISTVWTPEKVEYILQLLAPVGFLPLLNPQTLVISTPSLVSNLLSNHFPMHSIKYQYTAMLVPFIFISTIYGSAKLMRNRSLRILIPSLLILTSVLSNYYLMDPTQFSKKYLDYTMPERVEITNEALSLIPPDASVSASPFFVPHLTHREKIYEFPNPFEPSYWGGINGENPPPKDVDYILVSGYMRKVPVREDSRPPKKSFFGATSEKIKNVLGKYAKFVFFLDRAPRDGPEEVKGAGVSDPEYKYEDEYLNIIINSLLEEGLYVKIYERDNIILIKKIYDGPLDEKYKSVRIRNDPFIMELAVKEKDYTICDRIESFKTSEKCFKEIGIKTNDYNLCDWKIETNRTRDECFKEVGINTDDYNLCGWKISNYTLKEECFKEVGIKNNDYNLCDWKIKTNKTRDECFKEVAVNTDDANLCGWKISNETLKKECYAAIATKESISP